MVLTQPMALHRFDKKINVSIPLWFLRNEDVEPGWVYILDTFPYHYGSYATGKEAAEKLEEPVSFHTTMVLTQQEFEAEKLKILVRFPYHYGSHATIVKAGTIVGGNTSFHTTMVLTQLFPGSPSVLPCSLVSIPLWFLRNGWNCTYNRSPHWKVSIPLWFLRNKIAESGFLSRLPSFHTTMVLTQHNGLIILNWEKHRFHTTMVLTQPGNWKSPSTGLWGVSIPLWFLRNGEEGRGRRLGVLRFHTTMVLTQPQPMMNTRLWTSCFHTTMVLTQRNRKHAIVISPYEEFPYHYGSYATEASGFLKQPMMNTVSIPLWFLRNPG